MNFRKLLNNSAKGDLGRNLVQKAFFEGHKDAKQIPDREYERKEEASLGDLTLRSEEVDSFLAMMSEEEKSWDLLDVDAFQNDLEGLLANAEMDVPFSDDFPES